MPEVKITPNPSLPGGWLTFNGTGFKRTNTSLYLDGRSAGTLKPAADGSFVVGEIAASNTPKTQTLVAKQRINGALTEVARATVEVKTVVLPPPPVNTVPGVPTNLIAVAGDTTVALGWTAPTSDGGSPITGYSIVGNPGNVTKTSTGTTLGWTNLTNGTTFTFTVAAVNAVGTGPASSAASATPTGAVTPPPPGTQVPSGPVTFTHDGQIIENLIIDQKPGGTITFSDQFNGGKSVSGQGFKNCTLRNVTVRGRYWGIFFVDMDNLTLESVTATDMDYAAFAFFGGTTINAKNLTALRVGTLRTDINGHPQANNAYGVLTGVSSSVHGINGKGIRPTDVTIDGARVEDVPLWQGFNSHESIRLTIKNSTVKRTPRAIFMAGQIDNLTLTNNKLTECVTKSGGTQDKEGILISGVKGATITDNEISASYQPPPNGVADYGGASTGLNIARNKITTP